MKNKMHIFETYAHDTRRTSHTVERVTPAHTQTHEASHHTP